jgi:hydrogenase maturation protease
LTEAERPRVLLVGIGNELRGDDALGICVVRRLRRRAARAGIDVYEQQGDPVGLLDLWHAADGAVLVDAVRSGAPAGAIQRLDATARRLPASLRGSSSTHAIALDQAIELGGRWVDSPAS